MASSLPNPKRAAYSAVCLSYIADHFLQLQNANTN